MAKKPVKVRAATLDDVPGIVDVHRTDVLDGNPWLEVPSCAAHLNGFLLDGHTALVAEVGGRVVGEAEFLVADEAPFGRVASLNVICVHQEFRRQGVGRALMQRAFRLARRAGAQAFHVTPAPKAVTFYRRLRLELADRLVWVKCSLPATVRPVRVSPCDHQPYKAVRGLVQVFGRYISSRHTWWMTSRWCRLAGELGFLPRRFRLSVGRKRACLALEQRERHRVRGYGWLAPGGSPAMLFDRLCRLAGSQGGRTLTTLLSRTAYERLARRFALMPDGSEVLLSRQL